MVSMDNIIFLLLFFTVLCLCDFWGPPRAAQNGEKTPRFGSAARDVGAEQRGLITVCGAAAAHAGFTRFSVSVPKMGDKIGPFSVVWVFFFMKKNNIDFCC